ncbi:transporter [Halobaculum marinum]|uniref:Transporter n=1 Tax=Halobaculum marinum TaxID=3031996 RepID=A0ABD5X1H6_9EURY|nr:transporter [Halobaculum sp. DT55]
MGETTDGSGGTVTETERVRGIGERVSLAGGAVAGVGAYLIGYLATYVTQSGAVRDRLAGLNALASLFGGDPVAAWQGVGWYFYNAHFVATVVPSFGGTRTVDLIASADASVGYLYVLPPLALFVAGAAVAFLDGASDPTDGALAALGVVPAYFVLALAGAFLFAYGAGDAGSVHPEYVTAALLAGLVYPVVFGGIGGAVGGVVGGD